MHSRYEISLEQYALSIGVEAKTTLEMGETIILPAALRYQTELATNLAALKALDVEYDSSTLDAVSAEIKALRTALNALKAELGHDAESAYDEAAHARDSLLPAMTAVRAASDKLEGMVADDLWPLATYQEMLYIL
jgi:glutamine synthetase